MLIYKCRFIINKVGFFCIFSPIFLCLSLYLKVTNRKFFNSFNSAGIFVYIYTLTFQSSEKISFSFSKNGA